MNIVRKKVTSPEVSEQSVLPTTLRATVSLEILVIASCAPLCAIGVHSTFDGAFGGIGGLLLLTVASFMAFFAFGMIRLLAYANNVSEAWAILPCLLSALALYFSGMTVSFLEGAVFPQEVAFRSLNMGGYQMLLPMAFLPFFMACYLQLTFWMEQRSPNATSLQSAKRSLFQFIRQNWYRDFIVTFLLYLTISVSAFVMLAKHPPDPVSESHLSYRDFPRQEGFPSDGNDFCYTRSNSSYFCHFAISEEGFLDWAKTRENWANSVISSENPVRVDRPYPEKSFQVVCGWEARRRATSDNGVSEQAVFDRDSGRAWYWYSVR